MPRVKARDCAEAYIWYVAQAIPQICPPLEDLSASGGLVRLRLIDADIAEKGHLWMETG